MLKRRVLILFTALFAITPVTISSLFAAAPYTTNLLVSLDPSSATISGTTASASDGTTPTGTLQASGMYSSPNTWVTFGDSTNQYIDYGNVGSTPGNISLETWVNITTMHSSNWNIVSSKWFNGSTGSDWHFGYYQSQLRLCYAGACPTAGWSQVIRGTGWHHLAFTIVQPASGTCPGVSTGTVTLYFDGVQVAQDVSTGACHPTSSDMLFVIGDKRGTATLGIDGKVGKFRFYTRALSASEMGSIFRAEASTYSISAAPYNSSVPSFSGTAKVGFQQSGTNGTWLNSVSSYAYRWYRADSLNGNYTVISGATTLNYTPVSVDLGKFLKLEVTATNGQGFAVETSTATQMGLGETNLSLNAITTIATTKTIRNLTLTPGASGKATFTNNGKRISGCINLATNSSNGYSVTCPWKPGVIGFNQVMASFTSSDSAYPSGNSPITNIFVQKRSGTR